MPLSRSLSALLALLLFALPTAAQQLAARWLGGQILPNVGPFPPFEEGSFNLCADATGNLYVGGRFRGATDFGNGHTAQSLNNSLDGFLAKYDAAGQCQWVLTATGTGAEGLGVSLALLPSGDLHVQGFYTQDAVVDGQPLPTSTEGGRFLLRVTPQGGVRVVKNYLNPVPFAGTLNLGVTIPDGRGGCFLASGGFGTYQYDTISVTTNGQEGIVVGHADSTGHVQWVQLFGLAPRDGVRLKGLAADGQGGAYVSGYFLDGPIQINGQSIGQRNTYGVFLGRITAAGQWRWLTTSQVRSVAGGEIVSTFPDGLLLLAGRGGGGLRFTGSPLTSPTLAAGSVGHIIRFDSAGVAQRMTQYQGPANLMSGTTDALGNSYLVGFGWDSFVIPPLDTFHISRTGGQLGGTFLLKLDGATGQPVWGLTDDGTAQGWTWPNGAIAYAGPAGLVVAGTAYLAPRFGPHRLPTADGQDPFLARAEEYLVNGLPDEKRAAGLQLWPNPAPSGQAVRLSWPAGPPPAGPVTVTDALGRSVVQAAWPAGQRELALPLPPLPPGLYVVRAGGQARRLVVGAQ